MSAAGVTVIDATCRPRVFDLRSNVSANLEVRTQLGELRRAAEKRDAGGILSLAILEAFAKHTAIVSSFGAESAVLLHMVAQIEPTTPILFLNTGKLFGETI